jgi:single stranded DNA-binding protein
MSHASTTILGNLGQDPETRTVAQTTCTTLSVAVTRRIPKADGQKEERTTWWRVQVWGARGEAAATHLRKGDPIICTGWPELRNYTDKDGRDGHSARPDPRRVVFCGRQARSLRCADR